MEFNDLHFSHPAWLWLLATIPLMWILFLLFYRAKSPKQKLEKFIDSHLLPYLLVGGQSKAGSYWKPLLLWSLVWACLTLALAGPRWSFKEIEMLSKDQSLVILLDLSESMNANDVKPSRLIRAKQKIEDLLNQSTGVKIGLIAFAADPHMIAPLTEDKETIRHLLSSLDTDLVYMQGSRLSPALEMADTMLEAEPGSNKAVLLVSDGDFEDGSAIAKVKKMAAEGIVVHAMGMGTSEGAILQDNKGNSLKKNGAPILSKLVRSTLEDVARMGRGTYLEGHNFKSDEAIVLKHLEEKANAMQAGKKSRLWDEGFYWLLIPVLPIFLWWFRKGAIFSFIFMMLTPLSPLQADMDSFCENYFMNADELGKHALDQGNYESAVSLFQDPYRKGVAQYKAGHFADAEKLFRESAKQAPDADSLYNLGNALTMQQKFKEAIAAYEDVLKQWSDHKKAADNLELVKKMLEEQKKDQSQSDDSEQKNDESSDQKNDRGQQSKDKSNNSKNDPENDADDKNQEAESDENPDKSDQQNDQEKNDSGQDEGDEDKTGMSETEPEEIEAEASEGEQGSEETDEKQAAAKEGKETKEPKSQEEQDADFWLNRISNDPKTFLKNKFYLESKKNETKESIDPW